MSEEPQKLFEFTTNLLTDLESGAISPQEAISACQQYAYLRELLTSKNIELSEAATLGDEELLQTLKDFVTETNTKLKELPSFQGAEADAPIKEQDIRDDAAIRKAALSRSHEATTAKLAPLQTKRREFIRSLVSKYSETETESMLKKSFIEAAKEKNAQQSKERFVSTLASALPENDRNRVVSAIETNQDYFIAVVNAETSELERAEAIYTHLDIKRADVLIDVILNAPDDQKNSALIRGVKLAQVAQTLDQNKNNNHKNVAGGFFSHENSKGVTKGLQNAAEGILSLVGEPLREIIYKEKVNGTLKSLLTNTQALTDRLGETFVHSSLFTHISQNLTKSLSDKTTSMSQSRTIVGDLFGSIFKGPTDEAARERMFDYFELSRANAAAPHGRTFITPGIMPWEMFGASPRQVQQTPRFRWFPFLSLGALGEKIANVFSSSVDKTTSFLFTNPKLREQLNSSRRAALVPTPFWEDLPLLIATVVIAVLVYLYIFPSPFNTSQVGYSAKVSALLASLFQKDGVLTACANIQNVHLYQNDPAWGSYTCINSRPDVSPQCTASDTLCKIGASGCGTTSMTMILHAFGINKDIKTVWDDQHTIGGYVYTYSKEGYPRCLTDNDKSLNILRNEDLTVSEIGQGELSKIFSPQEQNCSQLVLASVDERWASGAITGHIIVITNVSGSTVTALDPGRKENISTLRIASPQAADGDIVIKRLWLVTNNKGGTP